MRAYIGEETGGAFKPVDFPRPTPGAGQVLVCEDRWEAGAGVNDLNPGICEASVR